MQCVVGADVVRGPRHDFALRVLGVAEGDGICGAGLLAGSHNLALGDWPPLILRDLPSGRNALARCEGRINSDSINLMADRLHRLGKRQLHAGNFKHAVPLLRSAFDMKPDRQEFETWYHRAVQSQGE